MSTLSLSSLLARAKATVAAVVENPTWTSWQQLRVDVGVEVLRGRFHFEDGDWVHWIDEQGDRHASPARFVTKEGT